jgi:hypothetical protein
MDALNLRLRSAIHFRRSPSGGILSNQSSFRRAALHGRINTKVRASASVRTARSRSIPKESAPPTDQAKPGRRWAKSRSWRPRRPKTAPRSSAAFCCPLITAGRRRFGWYYPRTATNTTPRATTFSANECLTRSTEAVRLGERDLRNEGYRYDSRNNFRPPLPLI